MTSFPRLLTRLRAQVEASGRVACFEAARLRHPALAEHDDISSVLAALRKGSGVAYSHKDALTLAMIVEQQASPNPQWACALIVAYYPMLSTLRHRNLGDDLDDDDLDQLVLTSFLSVVAEYPVEDGLGRNVMRLRQQTHDRVMDAVFKENREREHLLGSGDMDQLRATDGWAVVTYRSSCSGIEEKAEMVAMLVEHAWDRLDGESFDLVTATLVTGRRVSGFIDYAYPEIGGDDRRRLRERIKRRHSRAMARLRPALRGLRCPSPLCELCCGAALDPSGPLRAAALRVGMSCPFFEGSSLCPLEGMKSGEKQAC